VLRVFELGDLLLAHAGLPTERGLREPCIVACPSNLQRSRQSGADRHVGDRLASRRTRAPNGPRRNLVLLARAREVGATVTVPATTLAQATRNPRTQARLSRLIRQPATDLVPLDGPDATQVGILLAATGTSDIADAHVVVCARRSRQPIVTSDPDDLRRLDPSARLVSL
jgi:hypothetical protein